MRYTNKDLQDSLDFVNKVKTNKITVAGAPELAYKLTQALKIIEYFSTVALHGSDTRVR